MNEPGSQESLVITEAEIGAAAAGPARSNDASNGHARSGTAPVATGQRGSGRIADVRIVDGVIREIGVGLVVDPLNDVVVEAQGAALLPGLWDHHLHLPALAVAARSLPLGPPRVRSRHELRHALRLGVPDVDGWLRGIGYHESVAGDLDSTALDEMRSDVPIRVQHRSGGMWVFNSLALRTLASVADGGPDLHGRLLRNDRWLADALGALRSTASGSRVLATDVSQPRVSTTEDVSQENQQAQSFAALSAELSRLGVVGCTEASPGLGLETAQMLEAAMDQHLVLLSSAHWTDPLEAGVPPWPGSPSRLGASKIMVTEDSMPGLDALTATISAAHQRQRPVAVHVVSRAAMALVVAAFVDAGVRPGDRIEHASVTPPALGGQLSELGLIVVTQPNFIAERGDDYRRDVDAEDQPWLYRLQGHLQAGITLAGGTDAPFGDADPWAAMASAVSRRTATGHAMGTDEALTPEAALALFTGDPLALESGPRHVAVGAMGDLCLIDRPWRDARADLSEVTVRATIVSGCPIYAS